MRLANVSKKVNTALSAIECWAFNVLFVGMGVFCHLGKQILLFTYSVLLCCQVAYVGIRHSCDAT